MIENIVICAVVLGVLALSIRAVILDEREYNRRKIERADARLRVRQNIAEMKDQVLP